MYHFKTTIISIVRTKGKAGYRVWKSAVGQGDHEISLFLGSFEVITFSLFLLFESFGSNPFPITISKVFILTRRNVKSVL